MSLRIPRSTTDKQNKNKEKTKIEVNTTISKEENQSSLPFQ